jgi:hypothetical protein
MGTGADSSGVKRKVSEADRSSPSTAEVKNGKVTRESVDRSQMEVKHL